MTNGIHIKLKSSIEKKINRVKRHPTEWEKMSGNYLSNRINIQNV